MPRRAPAAFLFYPRDYLANLRVHAMTYEARGIYWQLCCLYWLDQRLPDDVEYLARVLKVPRRKLHKMWPQLSACFQHRNGGLRHAGLDEERARQIEWAAKSSRGGKIGAARRWAKTPTADDRGGHPLVTPPDDQTMTFPCPCPLEQEQEQEQKKEHARETRESHPVENRTLPSVLLKAGFCTRDELPVDASEGDLKEDLKCTLARARLPFDADVINRVLDVVTSAKPLQASLSAPTGRRSQKRTG